MAITIEELAGFSGVLWSQSQGQDPGVGTYVLHFVDDEGVPKVLLDRVNKKRAESRGHEYFVVYADTCFRSELGAALARREQVLANIARKARDHEQHLAETMLAPVDARVAELAAAGAAGVPRELAAEDLAGFSGVLWHASHYEPRPAAYILHYADPETGTAMVVVDRNLTEGGNPNHVCVGMRNCHFDELSAWKDWQAVTRHNVRRMAEANHAKMVEKQLPPVDDKIAELMGEAAIAKDFAIVNWIGRELAEGRI